jgi:copper chaperone CopZ
MHRIRTCTPLLVAALAAALASLQGCASTNVGASGQADQQSAQKATAAEENAIVHQVTQADQDATHSTQAMQGRGAILWVNGLGCPQCASNVDLQLKRMRGLSIIRPDLSTGKVEVSFVGSRRPSPQDFSNAIADAGFTLVKIESVQ